MSDLYCTHKRTADTCEDCAWQRANDDPALLVADPQPEVTRAANEARAKRTAELVDQAARADDDVSLAFAVDPPKGRRG